MAHKKEEKALNKELRKAILGLLADNNKHHITELKAFEPQSTTTNDEKLDKVLAEMLAEEEISMDGNYIYKP